jgi:hypothetical protein
MATKDEATDLGKQVVALEATTEGAAVLVVTAGWSAVSDLGSHGEPVYPTALLAVFAGRAAWAWATTPVRAAVERDGTVVLRARYRVRRIEAREVITVEHVRPMDYVLEWGPGGRRTRVRDRNGGMVAALTALNPDIAVLDLRPAKIRSSAGQSGGAGRQK